MTRLRSLLVDPDAPVSVGVVLILGAGGGIGWGLAVLLGASTPLLAVVVGAYLAMVAALGTLGLSLRLLIHFSVVCVGAVLLAQVTSGSVLLAAVVLAFFAYAGAVWALVPYVGQLGGGFAPLLFVLLLTTFSRDVSGAPGIGPIASALLGVAAAVIVAVVVHARDPNGALRAGVAAAWKPGSTLGDQALTAELARLSGRPAVLSTLLRQAAVATLSRSAIPSSSDSATDVAAANSIDTSIATAIAPPGRLVPRTVGDGDATPTPADASGAHVGEGTRIALRQWHRAQRAAIDILAGTVTPRRRPAEGPSLSRMVWGALFRPSDVRMRYGVQRALAIGGGWLILELLHWPEPLWVVITLLAVMQPGSPVTLVRAIQRGAGTLAGALAGAVLVLLLPAAALPVIAGLALVIGIMWIRRNYALTTALIAAAIVLIEGAPSGSPWLTAGTRILDTIVGVAVGWLVTVLVLPVRARPGPRRTRILDTIDAALPQLSGDRAATALPEFLRLSATRIADYRANIDLLGEKTTPTKDAAEADAAAIDSLVCSAAMLGLVRADNEVDNAVARSVADRLSTRCADLRAHPYDASGP